MKTFFRFLCISTLILLTASCKKAEEKQTYEHTEKEQVLDDGSCSCGYPHCVIYLQPYDNYTKQEANALIPSLKKNFEKWMDGEWTFKVLDPKPLPSESYVEGRNRYKAGTILNSLKKNPRTENGKAVVYMGLTHKDICADVHGVENYGIIGYSYCPGYTCVVSDKRVRNKSIVWKPVMHEFIHAFYGAPHCQKDDEHCFMKDLKGKRSIDSENKLCDSCLIFMGQI